MGMGRVGEEVSVWAEGWGVCIPGGNEVLELQLRAAGKLDWLRVRDWRGLSLVVYILVRRTAEYITQQQLVSQECLCEV